MNYVLILALLLTSGVAAWECSGHMIILQISLLELNDDDKVKLESLLRKMTSGVSRLSVLEAACFHHDMEAASFTGLSQWNSYELPYNETHSSDSSFMPPLMNSLRGVVTLAFLS